jgi:Mrp family chromosome partitioning ATPase
LVRCGHTTDATAAYERYQEALAAETGAAPDPALRDLHFAIARGDDRVVAKAPPPSAPVGEDRRTRSWPSREQLPPATDLVGRVDLAAEVSWLLTRERRQAVPIVVISGPGGIGKTALAVHAA